MALLIKIRTTIDYQVGIAFMTLALLTLIALLSGTKIINFKHSFINLLLFYIFNLLATIFIMMRAKDKFFKLTLSKYFHTVFIPI
jgi:hypothetical protein